VKLCLILVTGYWLLVSGCWHLVAGIWLLVKQKESLLFNVSYKSLEMWQLVKQLVIDIHKMTLNESPQFEMVE